MHLLIDHLRPCRTLSQQCRIVLAKPMASSQLEF